MEQTKLNIPKGWDNVTMAQWQEINSIDSDSEISKLIETISILADCDPEEIRQLGIKEYQALQQELVFLSQPLKNEVQLKIEVDGKKYGMIPHLDFITAGEWLDAETWKEKSVENLHLYCALLYRPILTEDGDEYTIQKHIPDGFMRRAELFKEKLPITTVYGSVLFFSSLGIGCMPILLDFLGEDLKPQTKKPMKKKPTRQATKKPKGGRSK